MSEKTRIRVGKGRPSVVGSARWKRAQTHQRRLEKAGLAVPSAPPVAVSKPSDLPAGQSAVWDALAPHASAARTLTPGTAWAFRDLCEAVVLKRDLLAVIEAEGLTSTSLKTAMDPDGGGEQVLEPKAHPLISKFVALMLRVETGLLRFKLSPMGKELAPVEQPRDGWEEFDQPLTVVQGGKR